MTEHEPKLIVQSASISRISQSSLRPSFHELKTPAERKANEQGLSHPASDCSPLNSASWLSTVSLRWMYPLLVKGAADPLQEHDIWDLPVADKAGTLQTQFDHYWRLEIQTAKARLLRALWRTTWPIMRVSVVLQLLCGGLGIVQPLLIKALVQFLEDKPNMFGIQSGYALAATLSLIAFASSTFINAGIFLAIRAGCNARTIGINSIYKKSLWLSSVARRNMSSGEVLTLASVDCERVLDAYRTGMWAVISPLVMVAVNVVIGTQTEAVVGLAVCCTMICVTLLAITTSREVGSCRREIAKASSERVKTMNETL